MKTKEGGRDIRKYFLFVLIAILIYLSYRIIQPYIVVLISAFILAYLVKPIYSRLRGKLGNSFSAVICIVVLFLVFLIPVAAVVGGIGNQAYNLVSTGNLPSFFEEVSSWSFFEQVGFDLSDIAQSGALLLVSLLSSAASYIPSFVLSLIVLFFGIYYILINWDKLAEELKNYLPFDDKNAVAKDIDKVTRGIIYGTLLVAIVQFIVAGVGFYLSGVQLFLLLPALIFFMAFIPGLGPTVVWIPLAIYYGVIGAWAPFVGVVITGLILSIYVDTIFRSKALGKRADVSPVIMLVGILGGIALFGIFGFIIGPLVLVYTLRILKDLSAKW